MKRSIYVIIFLMVMTMIWTTGCTKKGDAVGDSIADSVIVDTLEADTMESLIEETPMPKSADELFDDFLFNFAANKKLQMSRVTFPLAVDNYGKKSTIDKHQWRMEHFFIRQGFYTLVVGNMKDINVSKDTSVNHVVIEKIHLAKKYIQQYHFYRVNGQWMLQQLKTEGVGANANGGFYAFYDKFVRDSTFRQSSMDESIDFSGPDPTDDFAPRINGSIMPEQWAMFAPELPKDMIYNIVYGDRPIKGSQRILVIRGIANGLETELTFKKTGSGYKLVKLNT